MVQRILVTGGAGFIGSHTVDYLLAKEKEVVVLDNLTNGALHNLNLQHPQLEFIEGDILEYPLVVDLLSGCDAVLHLAALTSVPQSISDPIYSFQVNTQGFLHILNAIQEANRPIRLVYASSAAVYGDVTELPCRDDHPLAAQPTSPYALQKIHNEDYAKLYAYLHGIESLGLRYFNVYGPRQHPASPYSGVVSRFVDAFQAQKALTIFGDGSQARDFIAVRDVVQANYLALTSQVNGAVNIATGEPTTLHHLIATLEKVSGRTPKVNYAEPRRGDIHLSYGATHYAKELINFSASTSLAEGLSLFPLNPL